MNGTEFKAIRTRLGLTEALFATELGYTGKGKNRVNLIKDFESGAKRIPLYIARLAWLIGRLVPEIARNARGDPSFIDDYHSIVWPDWPGYTREELDDAEHTDKQQS